MTPQEGLGKTLHLHNFQTIKNESDESSTGTMIAIPQIFVALVVGVCCYLLAVAMTVYDGILSMIFQPIMGAIFTGVAIIALLILGLPIRLVKSINIWWKAHWWISLLLGCLAFAMMCASWTPQMRVKVLNPETQMQIDSFHPALAIGGWLLALFAILHFYPPLPWSKPKMQNFILIALCCLVSCSRNSIDLPGGYSLHDHGKILLQNSKGVSLSSDEISQFMVSGPHVYGWINNPSEEFFALNTSIHKFEVFPTWKSLDRHTDKLSLPRLDMKTSYTYWDIKSGRKHW